MYASLTTPATSRAAELTADGKRSLFAATMGFVAAVAALFALGAYLGRDLPGAVGLLSLLGAFTALLGMSSTRRRSALSVIQLAAVGLLLGVGAAPTLQDYLLGDPQAMWLVGGATALFVSAFGLVGWATRRDLSVLARVSGWALLGLVGFGIVVILGSVPGGALVYSVIGLVVFAGFIVIDFHHLRRSADVDSAPLLAVGLFLDMLNVFLFFLQIFSRDDH